MPELKLYTIAQLRAWLEENQVVDGLSETIVAPQRAYAIIHNPYVKDDDPVVAAIFVEGRNVAYTSAFPEEIKGKRYWWFSGLWCDPKHEGNGYGLIVVGSLAEVYGVEYCLDRWGANATVEIFTYLGHKTVYANRYMLGAHIHTDTVQGKLIHAIRKFQTQMLGWYRRPRHEDYSLRYAPYIDARTYAFIGAHSENKYFQHTQDYVNWGLHHSYLISAPLIERVNGKMPFAQAEINQAQSYAVQVWDRETLIGFYVIKKKEETLHVLYMFYEEAQKIKVFASIRDHVQRMHIEQCVTDDKELADYLLKQLYFPKNSVIKVSFSYPNTLQQPQEGSLQYGDGDCLIV